MRLELEKSNDKMIRTFSMTQTDTAVEEGATRRDFLVMTSYAMAGVGAAAS